MTVFRLENIGKFEKKVVFKALIYKKSKRSVKLFFLKQIVEQKIDD